MGNMSNVRIVVKTDYFDNQSVFFRKAEDDNQDDEVVEVTEEFIAEYEAVTNRLGELRDVLWEIHYENEARDRDERHRELSRQAHEEWKIKHAEVVKRRDAKRLEKEKLGRLFAQFDAEGKSAINGYLSGASLYGKTAHELATANVAKYREMRKAKEVYTLTPDALAVREARRLKKLAVST